MADPETPRADLIAAGDGEALDDLDEAAELELDPEAPYAPTVPDAAAASVARASGVYLRAAPPAGVYEELRIDIDGRFPQRMASGTLYRPARHRMHWAARLTRAGPNKWSGPIIFDDAAFKFRWTRVEIRLTRSSVATQQKAQLRMLVPGGAPRVFDFVYSTPWFRQNPVDFEFDWEQGRAATVQVNTCAHPDRPATLPCETLTIEKVYERVGMNVQVSPGGVVPSTAAGVKPTWSDFELHDTMEVYWTRFAPKSQWALWTFFAGLHDDLPPESHGEPPVPGDALFGIMFDSGLSHAGPEERQGCALFVDAISGIAPAGPAGAGWLERELFYTAVHEMGHALNLAHSFDKSYLGWIALRDEPEARSFMNYPDRVAGGERAFYKKFHYRFSSQELTFLRHARPIAVRPGGFVFFEGHGYVDTEPAEGLLPELDPGLRLGLRANREQPTFEFMEPVALELKLTNTSGEPRVVDSRALRGGEGMAVIVQRDRGPARRFVPYSQRCFRKRKIVMEPERSLYAPLRISADLGGWQITDPGWYTVQVALGVDGDELISNPLRLLVRPPHDWEQERLAQDYFSDDVGRILAFNGSAVLRSGNDTLLDVVERMGDSRAALHARLALGNVTARDSKLIEPADDEGSRMRIAVDPARPEEGDALLASALLEQPERAAESFGHIRYKRQVDGYSELLAERGQTEEAARAQGVLYDTMTARTVGGRPVARPVLQEIEERREQYRQG